MRDRAPRSEFQRGLPNDSPAGQRFISTDTSVKTLNLLPPMTHKSSLWNSALVHDVFQPFQEEAVELGALRDGLVKQAPQLSSALNRLTRCMDQALAEACHPIESEWALEAFARGLRHHWLEISASAASEIYRSPTADQTPATPSGRSEDFGYERDLHPRTLERRCHAFFAPTPTTWVDDHIVFSSGQAASTAALLMLDSNSALEVSRPFKVVHLGAYFETSQLLSLTPSLFHLLPATDCGEADLLIIEPISCDGRFSQMDFSHLVQQLNAAPRKSRVILIDDTLSGRSEDASRTLALLAALNPLALIRLNSGLKLFQAGLELGNVGILSVYSKNRTHLSKFCDSLRKIRTLCGIGLQFADVAALDAPWFLDRQYTALYENAVFAHNHTLAAAVAANNQLFEEVSHPSLFYPPRAAPYCVFRLKEPSNSAYNRLEQRIRMEASNRKLLFEKGGSFGFRGHRFDFVFPDNGDPVFLRIAMGRRAGWSCDGIVRMIQHFSAQTFI